MRNLKTVLPPFSAWVCLICLLMMAVRLESYSETLKSGRIGSDEVWRRIDSPILVNSNLEIPDQVVVKVESGVEIKIDSGIQFKIFGRLVAAGTSDQPIRFTPNRQTRWGAISFESTGSGLLEHCYFHRGSYAEGNRVGVVNAIRCVAPVIIDSCTFTEWPGEFDSKATEAYHTGAMVIRRCWFGPGSNEAVHGSNAPILVEWNTFAYRSNYSDAIDIGDTKNPGPIIRYNVFLGSDDDAIDLDDCDAYVEGNLVMNCRGGNNDPIGISGDRDSRPIIVNNVVINCESGIGFKNGADIVVLNNTIVNCDKGIWLHQNPTHATVYNTIIWGREGQRSVVLEPGSTIDVSYSIIQGEDVYEGEGNLNLDPRFVDLENLDFQLLPESPAIDAAHDTDLTPQYDFLNNERVDFMLKENTGIGKIPYIDIGAFEFIPEITRIMDWIVY